MTPCCPCGSAYHPRYRAAHVIGRPDRVRTEPLPDFDADVAACAWIAEMRAGQAVRP